MLARFERCNGNRGVQKVGKTDIYAINFRQFSGGRESQKKRTECRALVQPAALQIHQCLRLQQSQHRPAWTDNPVHGFCR